MAVSDWRLYSETDHLGMGRFIEQDCADIGNINTGGKGQLNDIWVRDPVTGDFVAVCRTTSAPANTALLTVPEDEAEWLKDLKRQRCVTAVQRRNCADGRIQTYTGVIINGEVLSRPTARGISPSTVPPAVAMPVVYRFRYEVEEDASPSVVRPRSDNIPETAAFVTSTFCGCESCGDDGCSTIYRAWNDPFNNLTYIEVSEDKGSTWTNLELSANHNFPIGETIVDIFCYHGRLMVVFDNGAGFPFIYSTELWRCELWTFWTQANGTGWVGELDEFIYGGQSNAGHMSYVYGYNLDAGLVELASVFRTDMVTGAWMLMWSPTTGDVPADWHIETISNEGSVVMVAGDGGYYAWSTHNGDPDTWRVGRLSSQEDIDIVDLYLPDPQKKGQAVALVATANNKVYKVELIDSLADALTAQFFVSPLVCATNTEVLLKDFCDQIGDGTLDGLISLKAVMDGRGYWWGRQTGDGSYYWMFDPGTRCMELTEYVEANNFLHETTRLEVCDNDPDSAAIMLGSPRTVA